MIEQHLDIHTTEGDMNTFVVHPEEGGPHPVVLYGTPYWGPMVDWLTNTMAGTGKIGPEDLDLFTVVDTPEAAAAAIIGQRT